MGGNINALLYKKLVFNNGCCTGNLLSELGAPVPGYSCSYNRLEQPPDICLVNPIVSFKFQKLKIPVSRYMRGAPGIILSLLLTDVI